MQTDFKFQQNDLIELATVLENHPDVNLQKKGASIRQIAKEILAKEPDQETTRNLGSRIIEGIQSNDLAENPSLLKVVRQFINHHPWSDKTINIGTADKDLPVHRLLLGA